MEKLIENFLAKSYGDGSGDGSGYGYGSGSGDGYGYGYGYGDGDGDGSGDGSGSGDGDGDGDGDGSGDGSGDGDGIIEYNGQKVYLVDSVQTIIESVHGQYAHGHIVNSDLTLTPCYIARSGDYFAHGATLAEAKRDAEQKALANEPIEQRIERFVSTYPDVDKTVPNAELYRWHNVLTGSCEFGRKQFAKDNSIDIEDGSMTIRAFIELTKSAFGGEVINQLKQAYN